jgi:hypothetical protein
MYILHLNLPTDLELRQWSKRTWLMDYPNGISQRCLNGWILERKAKNAFMASWLNDSSSGDTALEAFRNLKRAILDVDDSRRARKRLGFRNLGRLEANS